MDVICMFLNMGYRNLVGQIVLGKPTKCYQVRLFGSLGRELAERTRVLDCI